MPRSNFLKVRNVNDPYATFTGSNNFEWRILKTYKHPTSEAKTPYAIWYTATKSDLTYGSWEYGDAYRSEILKYGLLKQATPQWLEDYPEHQSQLDAQNMSDDELLAELSM